MFQYIYSENHPLYFVLLWFVLEQQSIEQYMLVDSSLPFQCCMFWASVFVLPNAVPKDIEDTIRRFV